MQEDQEEGVSCYNTLQDWNPQKYYKYFMWKSHVFRSFSQVLVFHRLVNEFRVFSWGNPMKKKHESKIARKSS